jgi:pyruvate dehydrogenase E1 component alpha subunit
VTNSTKQTADAEWPARDELAAYRTMLRLRRFEEKAGLLYALGTIGTPCPLGVGQEAALTALTTGLGPTDELLAFSDTPALELALGIEPVDVLRRLVPAPEGNSQPGALAWTRSRQIRRCAAPLEAAGELQGFDGAHPESVLVVLLHECAGTAEHLPTLAAMPFVEGRRLLPVLVVPRDERPEPDDLPATLHVREVDGTDVVRVAAALATACADAGKGLSGPCLVVLTPPYIGHSRNAYRRAPSRPYTLDPIVLSRRRLVASGVATEEHLSGLERSVREEVVRAARVLEMEC